MAGRIPTRQVHVSLVTLSLLFVIPLTLCAFLLPTYGDYMRSADGTATLHGTNYGVFGTWAVQSGGPGGAYQCQPQAFLFSAMAVASALPLVTGLGLVALGRHSTSTKKWAASLALIVGVFAMAIPLSFSLVFSSVYAGCYGYAGQAPGPQTSFEGHDEIGPLFPGGTGQVRVWGPGLGWWAALVNGILLTGLAALASMVAKRGPRNTLPL